MVLQIDMKNVVKHIAQGTLSNNLCRICLLTIDTYSVNILTKITESHCVADILEIICQIKFQESDQYHVCIECFNAAAIAYSFFLKSKQTERILEFYAHELQNNLKVIPKQNVGDSICISLPMFVPEMQDFDLKSLIQEYVPLIVTKEDLSNNETIVTNDKTRICKNNTSDNVIIVLEENGKPGFYKMYGDMLEFMGYDEVQSYSSSSLHRIKEEIPIKRRRKRLPLEYKSCSQCPIKYRFVSKLKDHMKIDHNIDLNYCKVCRALVEGNQEYEFHLKTHTDTHICAICHMAFKKRETIIAHLKKHEIYNSTEDLHFCEVCGQMLENEDSLKEHYDNKHKKKFICYYCGRMYKGEISFELHIKKHELNGQVKQSQNYSSSNNTESKSTKNKPRCNVCNKQFVDQRSLMWHTRLHNNERPYKCDICGREFVTLNRRNQHALCAHTAPSRRCPLCPALFHLRSMVTTHVKKVHLKADKRRHRLVKHRHVYWRTEPVPLQELSVAVQTQLLELQTDNFQQCNGNRELKELITE